MFLGAAKFRPLIAPRLRTERTQYALGMTRREPKRNDHELLNALSAAKQSCGAAVAEYKRLLEQAKTARLRNDADITLDLLNAVSCALGRQRVRSRGGVAVPDRKELHQFACLTSRENEIVNLLCEGLRANAIAARLDISPKTVHTYKTKAMRKLEVNNFVDLLRLTIARESGQVKKPPRRA